MPPRTEHRHRLRPRLPALPWVVGGFGVLAAFVFGTWLPAAGGVALGALYLLQPAWRLVIVADDESLSVRRGREVRMQVAWSEVKRVLVVPRWKVAFVDGGEPRKSLLLPGPGAPGPYRVERREELYDFILRRVPAEKVEERETLER